MFNGFQTITFKLCGKEIIIMVLEFRYHVVNGSRNFQFLGMYFDYFLECFLCEYLFICDILELDTLKGSLIVCVGVAILMYSNWTYTFLYVVLG